MNMLIHDTLAVEPTPINRKTSDYPNEMLENCSDIKLKNRRFTRYLEIQFWVMLLFWL